MCRANFVRNMRQNDHIIRRSELTDNEADMLNAVNYVSDGNQIYLSDGQIEKVLSSLHLRVSEIGEDMRLHHHFSTLSVNAANIRLRRVLRASLLQYGLMIITTVVAVRMRMCDTLNIAEKRNGRSSPLSSISAVLNCQRSGHTKCMHCFDRVVVCVHRLLLLTVFEFDCSTIQCVCVP